MKELQKYLNKNFKTILNYILGFSVALVLITFSSKMRAAVVITGFVVANIFVVSYKKFLPAIPIEVEVLTLGIVVSAVAFGWKEALIIAIIGGIFSFVFSGNLSPFAFPMLGGYIIIAILSFLLRGMNITYLGLLCSFAANSFVFITYHILFRYDLVKNLSFSLSNLFVNFILFSNLAPFLISIIA